MAHSDKRGSLSSRLIVGGLLVIIGILLLLETTDIADTRPVLEFIPSLFILLGVYAIIKSGYRNIVGPLILIALAIAVQLAVLDVITGAELQSLWPLAIVLIGLAFLAGHFRSGVTDIGQASIDAFAMFGGSTLRATAANFVGGSATAIFGGVDIDLRAAEIDEPPAAMSAYAIFGGVELIVPREWNVSLDAVSVFASVEDDRPRGENRTDRTQIDLAVTGLAMFGDITVKD